MPGSSPGMTKGGGRSVARCTASALPVVIITLPFVITGLDPVIQHRMMLRSGTG